MNKESISFKMDDYTITLHRGQEETEEMRQKRMTMFVTYLCNIALRPLIKCLKENYPDMQLNIDNIKKL